MSIFSVCMYLSRPGSITVSRYENHIYGAGKNTLKTYANSGSVIYHAIVVNVANFV